MANKISPIQKPRLWKYKTGRNAGRLRPSAKKYLSYKLKFYYQQKRISRQRQGIVKVKSYKKVQQIVSVKPLRNKVGQLMVKILAKKAPNYKVEVFGYSYINDLSTKVNYEKALKQASKHAYAQIPFSPDTMKVLQIKFIYFEDKKK